MHPALKILAATALLLPALPALAAARPERKAIERQDDRQTDRKTLDDGTRGGDQLNPRAVSELRAVPLKGEASARLVAAETTLESLGAGVRSPASARVVSYAFGVEAVRLGGHEAAAKGRASTTITPQVREAIDRLSPRDTAELLKNRGVSRDAAVVVLNRIERLKTDPSFLSGRGAAARVKSLLADREQGLSETQLSRNEDLADEVYGAQ